MKPNELTVHQLQGWCHKTNSSIQIFPDGTIYGSHIETDPVLTSLAHLASMAKYAGEGAEVLDFPPIQSPADEPPTVQHIRPRFGNDTPVVLHSDGYASLAGVLGRAFDQASAGKGKERHGCGQPFELQPMATIGDMVGTGGPIFQAMKKAQESMRLPRERAVAELLGAINYLAGAVLLLERQRDVAANDNQATDQAHG